MNMIKLLNGDLIAVEEGWDDREIANHLATVLDTSPYRIRILQPEKSGDDEDNDEKGEKDKMFRCAVVVEKDLVRMPCTVDKLTDYSFLEECQHIPTLRRCLKMWQENNYTDDRLLCLAKNPNNVVVDHLLSIPDLHRCDFYRTLSGNSNDRIVNWLLDEHPQQIHLPLFLCNTNPRVFEYLTTRINYGNAAFYQASQYTLFLRKVVQTREQIEWAHSVLFPSVMSERMFLIELCYNSRSSETVVDWFMDTYPTPESAYTSSFYILPRSISEKMVPYYLYYLKRYSYRTYDVMYFTASHPHPDIVSWWISEIETCDDLKTDLVGKHFRSLHSNPSDTMVDWLATGDKPFFNVYMFAENPNPRAFEMCLTELRKGWPKDSVVEEMFLLGMDARIAKFLLNEYPDECRSILAKKTDEGKYLSCAYNRLAGMDDWEEVDEVE